MIRLDFSTTNNKAKYEALISRLDLAIAARAKSMVVYSDSQIVTSQVNGSYECKKKRIKRYLKEVKGQTSNLQIKLVQILREENQGADRLAKAASIEPMIVPDQVLSFIQLSSLIDSTGVQEVSNEHYWMTLIAAYLRDDKLPEDKEAVRKLKAKAARFILIKNILYKRGFSRPYLRCLASEESDYIMREVHERIMETMLDRGPWTMAKTPTGETPFCMAYGSEAVIPAEVGLTSYRVENNDESKNDEAMRL
ncbi:uncharacterized protein LOC142606227 [Castanea sativa]|uniref:uncharacterized protein LOC142606227 n=1 Tax=Castanea sativa TaxID=21020 RepID=UPI003F652348